MQHQCTAALVRAKASSPLFSAALQIRLRACLCHCNYTYGNLLFMTSCAVMQHQCTAALVRAKASSPLFSAALQIRLRACLCHCNYTYGDLLFIQLCSDATAQLCEELSIGVIAVHKQQPDLQAAHLGSLFCPDQCCSALVLHHCTAGHEEQISIGVIAVAQACSEPDFTAALNSGELVLP